MKIAVLIGERLAGELDLDNGQAVFRYSLDYRRQADVPLSVQFPLAYDGAEGKKLCNWLEGLLPDDPDILRALCAEHGFAGSEALRLLGTPMGADCAGAVRFCPHDRLAALQAGTGGLEPIDEADIADWLNRMETDPARRAYRTDGADSGFSIAGIQPKVALRRTGSGGRPQKGRCPQPT